MMTGHPVLRGRRRIAHELGRSERTISRWVAQGAIAVTYEEPARNNVMVLPCVEEARQRDCEARERLRSGREYKASPEEQVEFRAWRRTRKAARA
jgi:hypothetical protein